MLIRKAIPQTQEMLNPLEMQLKHVRFRESLREATGARLASQLDRCSLMKSMGIKVPMHLMKSKVSTITICHIILHANEMEII